MDGTALSHGIKLGFGAACQDHRQQGRGQRDVDYSLTRWVVLTRLLEDAPLPIDNNHDYPDIGGMDIYTRLSSPWTCRLVLRLVFAKDEYRMSRQDLVRV